MSRGGHAQARDARAALAEDTLRLLAEGAYWHDELGAEVSIAAAVQRAVAGSVLLREGAPLQQDLPADPPAASHGGRRGEVVEVTSETSMAALYRLAAEEGEAVHIGLLNFASAKNPGGGFRSGAQAQEEALARASGLFPCLEQFEHDMYAANKRDPRGALYSDDMIFSPSVPFFRDDDGRLLRAPLCCSVITAPAVNCSAMKIAEDARRAPEVMQARAVRVLQLALARRVEVLILGAWGCGVFKNDPRFVARIFGDALRRAPFAGAFRRVVFPVPDAHMEAAFAEVLGTGAPRGGAVAAGAAAAGRGYGGGGAAAGRGRGEAAVGTAPNRWRRGS